MPNRPRVHRQAFLNLSPRAQGEKRARVERDKVSEALRHTRSWYVLRAQVLREAGYRCQAPGCGARACVVDHTTPHKGDSDLFFSRENLKAMCKPCHDSKTATHDGGWGKGQARTQAGSQAGSGSPLPPGGGRRGWGA